METNAQEVFLIEQKNSTISNLIIIPDHQQRLEL
jgi:hypothetical protein